MSTDTMYINSSRLLPTRSKNKTSNAMFPRSNSNTSIKNSNSKNNISNGKHNTKNGSHTNNKKHSQRVSNNNNNNNNSSNNSSNTNSSRGLISSSDNSKKVDSLRIPLPQTLPNGEKPNFGSSNSNLNSNTKRRNSHNSKDKSTKDITKNLKNLLLDNKNNKNKNNNNNNNNNNKKSSNKRSSSKSPKQSHKNVTNNNNSIPVNALKNQNTTPIMTFLTSPINGPGSIPNMNLSEQNISSSSNSSSGAGNTPTPTVSQMPRVGSQILTRPGINMGGFNPNNNPGPPQSGQQQQYPQGFLQQPQRLQSQFQQQPQQQYGLPMGTNIQPMQNMPSNIQQQQQQQMPMGNINPGGPVSQHFQGLGYPFALNNNYRLSSVDGPMMPQQIQLMTPMFNQQNGGQPHLPNNNMNIQQRQNIMSPNVTPMSIQSTQISPKPQQSNRVQPLSSSSSNSSAKKNKTRTTSHTFAGASFATDVPQESNLPKPSFL